VKQNVRVAQDKDMNEPSPGFWIGTIRQEWPFQLSAMTEPRENPTAWHESGLTQDTESSALIPAPARLTGNTMRHELPSQTSENVRWIPYVPTYSPTAMHQAFVGHEES